MALIDNAIYVAGARVSSPKNLDETYEQLHESGGMAWIGLYRPDAAEIHSVAQEFSLHPLAVEDALKGHQRSKLERFGETLFVVLRPARYLDAEEQVEFGEVSLFLGPGFAVTVRHAEKPDLANVRLRMESNPELLSLGPEAVLYAVLDEVVDAYAPVIAGLENDIDEIEDQLARIEAISAAEGVPSANIAHAGDGNLHPLIFTAADVEKAAVKIHWESLDGTHRHPAEVRKGRQGGLGRRGHGRRRHAEEDQGCRLRRRLFPEMKAPKC